MFTVSSIIIGIVGNGTLSDIGTTTLALCIGIPSLSSFILGIILLYCIADKYKRLKSLRDDNFNANNQHNGPSDSQTPVYEEITLHKKSNEDTVRCVNNTCYGVPDVRLYC